MHNLTAYVGEKIELGPGVEIFWDPVRSQVIMFRNGYMSDLVDIDARSSEKSAVLAGEKLAKRIGGDIA